MTGIVLATGNAHKATELAELLAEMIGEALVTMPLADVRGAEVAWYVQVANHLVPPPEIRTRMVIVEDATSFRENAALKVQAISAWVPLPVLADDSGLEVAALNGRPGIHTARYAGPNASDADNVEKLLVELKDVTDRRAAFVAELVLRLPDGTEWNGTGICKGEIATEARGTNGFGYDPIFIPRDGDGRTFGEMTADEKHSYSHRSAAFAVLGEAETWKRLVTGVNVTTHPEPEEFEQPSWQ